MKRDGDSSELAFAARATKERLTVSIPFGNPHYDLVVDNGSRLYRIQVKSTTNTDMTKHGKRWRANTSRRSLSPETYSIDDADFYAIHIVQKDVWYIVPIKENNNLTMTFYPELDDCWFARYKESWGLLK